VLYSFSTSLPRLIWPNIGGITPAEPPLSYLAGLCDCLEVSGLEYFLYNR
jgi:hypothetical protein